MYQPFTQDTEHDLFGRNQIETESMNVANVTQIFSDKQPLNFVVALDPVRKARVIKFELPKWSSAYVLRSLWFGRYIFLGLGLKKLSHSQSHIVNIVSQPVDDRGLTVATSYPWLLLSTSNCVVCPLMRPVWSMTRICPTSEVIEQVPTLTSVNSPMIKKRISLCRVILNHVYRVHFWSYFPQYTFQSYTIQSG